MLNDSGDPVAAEPEPVAVIKSTPSVGPIFSQVVLIVFAGFYLLGVVWMYVRVPWIALGVCVFAAIVAGHAWLRRLRAPGPFTF